MSFALNSPIVNSSISVYNNIMVMKDLNKAFATNVYQVDIPSTNNNIFDWTTVFNTIDWNSVFINNATNIDLTQFININNQAIDTNHEQITCGNFSCSNLRAYSIYSEKDIVSDRNVTAYSTWTTSDIHCGGDLYVSSNIFTTCNINAVGDIVSSRNLTGNNLYVSSDAIITHNINCSNLNANTSITCCNIAATGDITTSRNLTGNNLYVSADAIITHNINCSNLNANTSITCCNIAATRDIATTRNLTGYALYVNASGNFQDVNSVNVSASIINCSNISLSNIIVNDVLFGDNNNYYGMHQYLNSGVREFLLYSCTNGVINNTSQTIGFGPHLFSHKFNEYAQCFRGDNNSGWSYFSDVHLKENIESLSYGLQSILQVRPVNFDWKIRTEYNNRQTGFIAQEVQNIFPDMVKKSPAREHEKHLFKDEQCLTLYLELVPYLVQSIQELYKEIQDLKEQIKKIKTE